MANVFQTVQQIHRCRLAEAPFNLDTEACDWVALTLQSMSEDDKIRQLFVLVSVGDDLGQVDRLMALRPGGLHRMVGSDFDRAWRASRRALERSSIPPLLTADLEGGGHSFGCVTALPNQMGLAAAADTALSAAVVRALAQQARALGINWSFTPVTDLSVRPDSAVVGTRSYGSDLERVIDLSLAHVGAMQAVGLAATAKHWPGEGHDGRDQHLVTTINPLSMAEWHASFGRLYRSLIEANVMTVMSAHIALPAWMRQQNPAIGVDACLPASLNPALNLGLLRGELGFNGLIVSDATLMAGLGSWADRSTLVPQVIESGCDIFLFSRHEVQDIEHMQRGLHTGRLSRQRLEDAVTRILGLKAALGLHRQSIDERLAPLEAARTQAASPAHEALAAQVATRSVTLVKDVHQHLPLSTGKHRRIVLIGQPAESSVPGVEGLRFDIFLDELRSRGFEVRAYDAQQPPTRADTDLVLYVLMQESMLTLSRIFLDWRRLQPGLLASMERYWHELPTVMVSFGHPFHLYDAPRVPTYVNAYSGIDAVQAAVVRKLVGEEPFTGHNPVDAFCGLPDAPY